MVNFRIFFLRWMSYSPIWKSGSYIFLDQRQLVTIPNTCKQQLIVLGKYWTSKYFLFLLLDYYSKAESDPLNYFYGIMFTDINHLEIY